MCVWVISASLNINKLTFFAINTLWARHPGHYCLYINDWYVRDANNNNCDNVTIITAVILLSLWPFIVIILSYKCDIDGMLTLAFTQILFRFLGSSSPDVSKDSL